MFGILLLSLLAWWHNFSSSTFEAISPKLGIPLHEPCKPSLGIDCPHKPAFKHHNIATSTQAATSCTTTCQKKAISIVHHQQTPLCPLYLSQYCMVAHQLQWRAQLMTYIGPLYNIYSIYSIYTHHSAQLKLSLITGFSAAGHGQCCRLCSCDPRAEVWELQWGQGQQGASGSGDQDQTQMWEFSLLMINYSRAFWWLCRTPHPSPWWSSSLTTGARTWCSRGTSSGWGRPRRLRSGSSSRKFPYGCFCVQVFIVLTPAYEGRFNGPSLPAFSRMGKVILLFHLSFILSYKDQWHRWLWWITLHFCCCRCSSSTRWGQTASCRESRSLRKKTAFKIQDFSLVQIWPIRGIES